MLVVVTGPKTDRQDVAEERALADQLGLRRSTRGEGQPGRGPYVHAVAGVEDQTAYAIGYYKCYRDARAIYQGGPPDDSEEPYELAREVSTERRRAFTGAGRSGCYEGFLEGAASLFEL